MLTSGIFSAISICSSKAFARQKKLHRRRAAEIPLGFDRSETRSSLAPGTNAPDKSGRSALLGLNSHQYLEQVFNARLPVEIIALI